MSGLDYRTAGESHGKACLVIVEGMPAGLDLDLDQIDAELRRRQSSGFVISFSIAVSPVGGGHRASAH